VLSGRSRLSNEFATSHRARLQDDELYGFGCRSNVSSAAVDHHRRSPALVCWSVSPYMPISPQSSLAEAYFENRLCAVKA
jgi:hypothetical protein